MGTEVGQNIRVIGVFGEKRIATFPDVPTVKEQGYDVGPGQLRRTAGAGRPRRSRCKPSSRAACAGCGEGRRLRDDRQARRTARRLFRDAAGFRQRLHSDIASKARVLSRLKTP